MPYIERIGKGFRAVQQRGGSKGPTLPTEVEAQRWAIARGWMPAPTHNLNELVQAYIDARLSDDHPITVPFSRQLRERLASVFAHRQWTTAADVTLQAVDKWRVETKGKGVARMLAYLLAVLRWAAYHKDVPVDRKVLEIRRPRQKRKIKARLLLTDQQVRDAVDLAVDFGAHAHAIVHYLATYGARPVTACKLRVRDIDFSADPPTLTVDAKHSGEWKHPLRADTAKIFAVCATDPATGKQRHPAAPLFLPPIHEGQGRPMALASDGGWKLTDNGEAETLARWYYRNIGLPLFAQYDGQTLVSDDLCRIYHLKRYAITKMLDEGMSPKDVAEFTGHLSLAQVMEYARTSPEKSERAIAMLPDATRVSRHRRRVH